MWRSAKNIARSPSPPSPPLRSSMVMAPSSDATMFTSSHGLDGCAVRASAATRAPTSSTVPGSGHNRRMRANLPVAGWRSMSEVAPPPHHHHVVHPHAEPHRSDRAGWLRAAVLGANDGVVSTACLIVGVAGAGAGFGAVRTAGIAGLAAGALSMALGEYVSVSSQRDIEQADVQIEARALRDHPAAELRELALIWEARGVQPELALEVARQLTEKDALAAHVRDELGLT